MAAQRKVNEQLEELRQQMAKNAPSMVPQPRPVKEEKVAPPPLPTVQSIISNRADRLYLIRKVEEYGELCQKIAEIKRDMKRLQPILKQAAARHNMDKVNFGNYTLNYYGSGSSSSISRDKLLEHGIAPDVIKACTVTKEKAKALKVTPVGVEDEEPEEEV